MEVNFLIFLRGTAGNFISRILTLCPTTVPLSPVGHYRLMTAKERYRQYNYDNCPTLPIKPNDRHTWWNFELQNAPPLTAFGIEQLIAIDLKIIQFCHPEYLQQNIDMFGDSDYKKYFIVDFTGAENWVVKQMQQKTGEQQQLDKNLHDKLTKDRASLSLPYEHKSIYLKEIIASKKRFVNEYTRICDLVGIGCFPELAVELRSQWQTTWG
jgi:hypothetical protein